MIWNFKFGTSGFNMVRTVSMVWYAEFGTTWYSMVQKALDILVEYGGKPSLGHLSTAKTWSTLVSAILRLGGCSFNWGNFGPEFLSNPH